MPIDPTQPVTLKRTIIDSRGNVYDPRTEPYPPGQIPARFLTDEYVTQEYTLVAVPPPTTEPIRDLQQPGLNSELTEFQPQVLELQRIAPVEGSINPAPLPPIEEGSSEEREAEGFGSRLNINQITTEQITENFRGIGPATAQKVVTARTEKPFENISDLNERVPIPLGKDWRQFSDLLEF